VMLVVMLVAVITVLFVVVVVVEVGVVVVVVVAVVVVDVDVVVGMIMVVVLCEVDVVVVVLWVILNEVNVDVEVVVEGVVIGEVGVVVAVLWVVLDDVDVDMEVEDVMLCDVEVAVARQNRCPTSWLTSAPMAFGMVAADVQLYANRPSRPTVASVVRVSFCTRTS